MEYLTSCYRQRAGSGGFLLLRQYQCRQTPVCFACIDAERSDKKDKLLEWADAFAWHKAAERPARWLSLAEEELEELLDGYQKCKLLIGIGREILVMGEGGNVCLLNTSFGRGKLSPLPGQFRAELEECAGILLATDLFLGANDRKELGEALKIAEIRTAEQAQRRLEELAGRKRESSCGSRGQGDDCRENMAVLLIGRESGGMRKRATLWENGEAL